MAPPRPNILIIMSDQQRLDTIGAFLNNFGARTPAMDLLVRCGATFDQAFTTCPICSPARAALMTGLMPTQAGIAGNLGNPSAPLNYNITTLAHRMQNAGYSTVYHGKSHLGTDLGQLGFKTHDECSHDPSTVNAACRFWRDRDWIIQKRPFFHVISLMNPHDIYFLDPAEERPVTLPPWANRHDTLRDKPWPQQTHTRGRNWSDQRWEYYRQFYRERLEILDRDLKTLLDELLMGGFAPNTWVIFTSDHGDMGGEHGAAFKGPFLYDAQVRVPLIIMPPRQGWPGPGPVPAPESFKPGLCHRLTSHLDIVPTVLDLAGVEPDPTLRGQSLVPAVCGDDGPGHEALFSELTMLGKMTCPMRMVRTKNWKYTLYLGHGEELYDLEADPGELHNLATKPAQSAVKADLKAQLMKFVAETGDSFFQQQPTDREGRPFTTAPLEAPPPAPPRDTDSRVTWER